MSQPGQLSEMDVTVLDAGRTRRFPPSREYSESAETLIDPGRRRPDPGAAHWPDGALPEPLAERYVLIGRLEVRSSQGELYRVRVKTDGSPAILKRHHHPRQPHPDLVGYLTAPHEHVARHLEVTASYTVTAEVPGRNLRDRHLTDAGGFNFAQLHAMVQQISAALIDLHRAGLVHRDVKPANVLTGPGDQVNVTLIDFGIAGPADGTDWPDVPNPRYQPPEGVLLGQVGPPTDWWGLGITILELASGEHPFDHLEPEHIQEHFGSSRRVDVSGVPNDPSAAGSARTERLRNLCQGLLCSDPAERWGAEKVGRWLVGQDPDLPHATTMRSEAHSAAIAAEQPYPFLGTAYYLRDDLAQAMAKAWNHAVQLLIERDGGLEGLRAWLEQFPDQEGARAREVLSGLDPRAPGHVRLLRVLQALDPARPPIYRNHVISRHVLRKIARAAVSNEADRAAVVTDLWDHHLLRYLDTAAPRNAEDGGEDLAGLERDWHRERRGWDSLVRQVEDAQARQYLYDSVTEPQRLAVCLLTALHQHEHLVETWKLIDQYVAEMPVPVPWFESLVYKPAMTGVAWLVAAHANSRARAEADKKRAEERARLALAMSASFREWSRRQNRPAAMGWAVAGVCLMALAWIVLITAADAGWADDTTIGLAWVGAAICLAVSLVAECLLSVEIGGRFHPRYSIPGAGMISLRPLGRWMQRAWFPAVSTTLAVLAVIVLIALEVPQVLAIATTLAHLSWVMRRWIGWRIQIETEKRQIAEMEQQWESGTDAGPVGAAGGADS